MAESSVVLEEEIDENYEPTQEDILEYAQWLGMELPEENELLWIAREGLKAPLPDRWKPCRTQDDEIYYFNFSTGESVWDHPCDEHYRNLYKDEKAKLHAKRQFLLHEQQPPPPQQQSGEPRSGLLRQASLPPQPGQQQKPLQRMGSLQAIHTIQQRSLGDEEKRRKASVERGSPSSQPISSQGRPVDGSGSNPGSPMHEASGKNRASSGRLSRSSSRGTQNSGSETEAPQRVSNKGGTARRHSIGVEMEVLKEEQSGPSTNLRSGILKKQTGQNPQQSNSRNFGTWSPEVSGGSVRRVAATLARGGSGDLTVATRHLEPEEWTDSETDDGGHQKPQYPASPHARVQAMAYGDGGRERLKLVTNSLRRSESGNPLGSVLVAPSRYAKISDKERDLAIRQQQQRSQLSPSKSVGALKVSDRKQRQEEVEERRRQEEQHRREREREREGVARDNEGEVVAEDFRRQQTIDRQRGEHEDWDVQVQGGQERDSAGRDDRRKSMESSTMWKAQRQNEHEMALTRLDEGVVADMEEGARLQEIANASRRRLAKFEAECDVRLAKLQADREILVRKREKEITKLAERLGQPLDEGALVNARSVVVEEGRALIAQEREIAVATAREEGEREKQRILARIHEELGMQLALERQRMAIDPGKTAMEPATSGERSNPEALVRQWKAKMEQEQAAASQGQGEQAGRIKVLVAEDEMRMLESARREAAVRVEKAVEQEERREWDGLMKQMRDRIRVRIVEEERKALQQERLEMLDRVGEVVAEQEAQELEKKRKEVMERVENEVEAEAVTLKQVKLEEARKRVDGVVASWEEEEKKALAERVKQRVRELEKGTLENERAKVMEWVRKRVENEGRDYAEQHRAKVRMRVEEEEARLTDILIAEMEERVKERIEDAEEQLLESVLAIRRDGLNGERRLFVTEDTLDELEKEKWVRLDELRKQMEMRVADQIASEEAELVVQKRKEMQARAELLLQEEERRAANLQKKASSARWSSEGGGGTGKLDGVVRSMEMTQADVFREMQAKVVGEKQSLEIAVKEHLALVRKDMLEKEKKEIEVIRAEMHARVQKTISEEEKLEMERLRLGIKEKIVETLEIQEQTVAEAVRAELRLKLEERLKVEAEELTERLRAEMMERVRAEVEAEAKEAMKREKRKGSLKGSLQGGSEESLVQSAEANEEESEWVTAKETMLKALEAEMEEVKASRLVKMDENLALEVANMREEKMMIMTREVQEGAEKEEEGLEGRLREEEAKLWEAKLTELEVAIDEQLKREREERYEKAKRAMEMNLRYQIAAEREKKLSKSLGVEEGNAQVEEGIEEVLMQAKTRLTDELMREVEAEIAEYREKLSLRAETEDRWRRMSEEMAQERSKMAEGVLKEDFSHMEVEQRLQAEAIQRELSAGLEEFRAHVKSKFDSDCVDIKKNAERDLERVKDDMEGKVEQKVARLKAETRQVFDRARREMDEALLKQMEEERASRLARLAEELDREEMEIRRQWEEAMVREEGLVKAALELKETREWKGEKTWQGKPNGEEEGPLGGLSLSGDGKRGAQSHGRKQQELPTLPEWEENTRDDVSRLSGEEGGEPNSSERGHVQKGISSSGLEGLISGKAAPFGSGLQNREEMGSNRKSENVQADTGLRSYENAAGQEIQRQENAHMELTRVNDLDNLGQSERNVNHALALSGPSQGGVEGNGREFGENVVGFEERSGWGKGGNSAGENADELRTSPNAAANKSEPSSNRRKSIDGEKAPISKWNEGGWSTRSSHRRSRHRRRAADESEDYYSAWTDTTAAEMSPFYGHLEARRRSVGRRVDVNENGIQSEPPQELSISERAKLFVAEQERFLQERQIVIEQARADWRRRMHALDQLSDEEERRRSGSYLMEVKATLDEHVQQLEEDIRHVCILRFSLPAQSTPSKLDRGRNSSLRTSIERTDTDLSNTLHRMDMDLSRSIGRLERELSPADRRMDSDQSRALSRMDSDQFRTALGAESLDLSPPHYWEKQGKGGRASALVSQPGSPSSAADLSIAFAERRLSREAYGNGERRVNSRRRSMGEDGSWLDEVYRTRIGNGSLESFRGNGFGSRGKGHLRERAGWMEGRYTDDESLLGRRRLRGPVRKGNMEALFNPLGATMESPSDRSGGALLRPLQQMPLRRTVHQQRELLGYLNETDERKLTTEMVKQHSNWLTRFQEDMASSGLPLPYRPSASSTTSSASPLRLSVEEFRNLRSSHSVVPKLRVDIDNERELVINIRPK